MCGVSVLSCLMSIYTTHLFSIWFQFFWPYFHRNVLCFTWIDEKIPMSYLVYEEFGISILFVWSKQFNNVACQFQWNCNLFFFRNCSLFGKYFFYHHWLLIDQTKFTQNHNCFCVLCKAIFRIKFSKQQQPKKK